MPYGFLNHLEQNGYEQETLISYEKVLNKFFAYINSVYKKSLEPFEISPIDIKQYLAYQLNNQKKISTVNKELAILKTFFNYLWEKDIVKIDPTVKIKRFKYMNDSNQISITYTQLLEILDDVLNNKNYSLVRKSIFLLATKGLKTSEFRFKKNEVKIVKNDLINILLNNRSIDLKGKEATFFLEYYNKVRFNDNPYVFTTTRKNGDKVPIEVMTILYHLRAISEDYLSEKKSPLTLTAIRKAIIYHLYLEKTPIQKIAKQLGIEENSVANHIKSIQK